MADTAVEKTAAAEVKVKVGFIEGVFCFFLVVLKCKKFQPSFILCN